MSRQAVKRTCPVCHGSGRPTGDKSFGESITGYCYKCHGSGEVTDYYDVPATRSSSYASSSSDGCAVSLFLFTVVAALFLLAIGIILVVVVLRALYKMLSTKQGAVNFLKTLAAAGLGFLVYGAWAVAVNPMILGWEIVAPWNYFLGAASLLPAGAFVWGEIRYKLLSGVGSTFVDFFRYLFEGLVGGWKLMVETVQSFRS